MTITPCPTVTITPKGYLTINSTPTGARIWLAPHGETFTDQGIDTSNTLALAVGSYDVRLVRTGYLNWEDVTGTITVTSEATTTVNATFAGSVNMTSTPAGARIWLAVSPGTPADLGPGMDTPLILTGMTAATSGATTNYNYKLTKAGYADATGSFTATAGTTFNVPVTWSAANITATDIVVTPSQTPCMAGTCTVVVDVTWTNQGGSPGAFTPNVSVDGTPLSPAPYPSENLNSGASVTRTFTLVGLSAATHTICPIPN